MRGLAVALVFLHHVDQGIFPGGFLGVDLFFALSGYLITSLLLLEWGREDRIWLTGFYIRRALRLAPALVALVVIVFAVNVAFFDIGHPVLDAGAAITYLMDVRGAVLPDDGGVFAHTWSLAVEEQFYLVWPLLLIVGLRRGWRLPQLVMALIVAFTVITAVATLAGRGHFIPGLWQSKLYRFPTTHVAELGAGVLLAVTLPRSSRRAWKVLSQPLVGASVILGLLVALFFLQEGALWLYLVGFTLAGLAVTVLIAHVLQAPESPVATSLRVRPAVWLGERSYGFYLWHYPVLLVLADHVGNTLIRGLIGLVLTLAFTQASWIFVEQPFLRRKPRFEPASRARDPEALPPLRRR
jgi:peptidoglycan/LPS O-acetylase OafA/YrhL